MEPTSPRSSNIENSKAPHTVSSKLPSLPVSLQGRLAVPLTEKKQIQASRHFPENKLVTARTGLLGNAYILLPTTPMPHPFTATRVK